MMSRPHRLTLAVALAACALTAASPPATGAPAAAVARPEVRLPHISIVSIGKGSPVVLIPGLSTPRAVWDGIAAALRGRHEVLLVQINGFAGDPPGANLQPGVLSGAVGDLHGYLAKRKLTGVPVVGHSLGGLLTLMLATAHPRDVGKGMIVDALPFIGELFGPGATLATVEPQARAMRDLMTASYGKPANAAAAEQTANGLALKPGSRASVKAWAMAADPRVSGLALYEDMTTDLRSDLAGIATPLTIVVPFGGMLSEERALGLYRGAYAKAPGATLMPVGDSAHFVMLDQPAAFQTALETFLRP